jgi:hypothetical protein
MVLRKKLVEEIRNKNKHSASEIPKIPVQGYQSRNISFKINFHDFFCPYLQTKLNLVEDWI